MNLSEAPPGTRASITGEVPASLSFNDWLRRMDSSPETRSIVDETLGRERAKVFRSGVPVTRFVDSKHRPLTLEAIRKREGLE